MESNDIQNLLTQVAAINKKYENIEAITGSNFNIFKILKMEYNEVKTHSAFIAELLKPNGSHGQKETFLKSFVRCFNIPEIIENQPIDFNKTEVEVEESSDNGRIDIVLKFNNGKVVVIENKIHAQDQESQLARYKNDYPDCYLIYLTLSGDKASDSSIKWSEKSMELHHFEECSKGEKCPHCYYTYSYKNDMLKWLIECHKESSNFPILRETITQYINLIKQLTHQTMSDEQKNELVKIIVSNSNYIDAAGSIQESWENIKYEIIEQMRVKIFNHAYLAQNSLKVAHDTQLGERESSFWFFKDNWNYCIEFYFGETHESIAIGICKKVKEIPTNSELEKLICESLNTIEKTKNYPDWIWVVDFQLWSNTDWKDIIKVIPDEVIKTVDKIVRNLETSQIQL